MGKVVAFCFKQDFIISNLTVILMIVVENTMLDFIFAAADTLGSMLQEEKLKRAQEQKIGGLAFVAGAVPAGLMGGLKYAVPMLGYGLFQLYRAHQNENDAYAIARARYQMTAAPRMELPRPRPY